MLRSKKENLKELREAWGKQVDKYRNFDLISFYHEAISKSEDKETVDDKTWLDLNLESFFSYMDRATSSIGQQFLFHMLKSYERNSDTQNKRNKTIQFLKGNHNIREDLQLKLKSVNNTKSYFISSLIFGDLPERPKLYYLLYLLPILMAISIMLIPFHNQFLMLAIGISILNIFVEHIYTKKIYRYFAGFAALNNLINCALSISKLDQIEELPEIGFLKKNRHVLKRMRKKIGFLVFDRSGGNEFIGMVIAYLNLIFLYDLTTYLRSIKYLETQKRVIQHTFESVAELDAAISIASFLEDIPYYTVPEFTQGKEISFSEVYHPLIKDAVSNSIKGVNRSVLIT